MTTSSVSSLFFFFFYGNIFAFFQLALFGESVGNLSVIHQILTIAVEVTVIWLLALVAEDFRSSF